MGSLLMRSYLVIYHHSIIYGPLGVYVLPPLPNPGDINLNHELLLVFLWVILMGKRATNFMISTHIFFLFLETSSFMNNFSLSIFSIMHLTLPLNNFFFL